MFVLGNIIITIARLLDSILSVYSFVIIVSALISWVNPDPYNPIIKILRSLTEPVLNAVRRILPFTQIGGIDLAPMVVLIAIFFIQGALITSLIQLGHSL